MLLRGLLLVTTSLVLCGSVAAEIWKLAGPEGGDVRALGWSERQPQVVYLGTAEGILFRSDDAGRHWRRLEPGFPISGVSLDNIQVTPAGDVLVGYWSVSGQGGGVARSSDGGRTFKVQDGIAGESVRALAVAPSDPARLVAGALSGVFATDDAGASWRRISPPGHLEIRNIESIVIDALDPRVIYAGTWHLPWKTTDSGKTWRVISAGMIDDSDVFTMTLDLRTPKTLFATACTGIYRSLDAGGSWSKFRGIPSSSRRTRAFAQDPDRPETLFAGTTEGLWVSDDSGANWSLRTDKSVVVNAIVAMSGGTLLLGTDGAGVLRSQDRGLSSMPSNQGFSARLLGPVIVDRENGRLLAAIKNDRVHGGVMIAPRAEGPWTKLAAGLEGREITSLALSRGDVIAGTDGGVYAIARGAAAWRRLATESRGEDLQPRVNEVTALADATLLAATDKGLLRSSDRGRRWEAVAVGPSRNVISVAVLPGGAILAATPIGVYESNDRGASFVRLGSGPDVSITHLLAFPGDGRALLATTSSGLYKSVDGGRGFYRCYGGLPISEIAGVTIHPDGRSVFASDFVRGGLYRSDDAGETWRAVPTEGLMPDRVWSMTIDPDRADLLLAATASGGLHVGGAPNPAATHN